MSWFSKIVLGTDLEEEQARNDKLNEQLAELNRKALERGTYTNETFAIAEAQRQASNIENVAGAVTEEFKAGLEEGADNIRGAAAAVVTTPLKLGLRMVPFWAWLLLAGWLAWKLGLLNALWNKAKYAA